MSDDRLGGLLARTAAGDERALDELYTATSSQVYGLVLRIVRDPAAAQEAVMDVYLQVWRRAASYDPERGAPRSWLLVLARSRAIDRVRASANRVRRETALDTVEEVADPSQAPDVDLERAQSASRIQTALAGLPEAQRQAINAAFFDGLTHSEIAAALSQPLGTIKTRIRRGMASLRKLLTDEPRPSGSSRTYA